MKHFSSFIKETKLNRVHKGYRIDYAVFVSLQVSESNGEVESYRQHFEKFTIDFRTFKERCEQHKKLVQDMGEQTPDVLKYGKENEQVWPL